MALVVKGRLVIDCNDLSCLTFTDITGGYSVSNTGGYGTPNPTIANIASIDFSITDSNSVVWQFTGAPYVPNLQGDNPICLTAADFTNGGNTLALQGGQSYILSYQVNYTPTGLATAATTQAPSVGVGQISTITISGTYIGGEVITVVLSGTETVNYTVVAGQTFTQIAAGLNNAISNYVVANPASDWATDVSRFSSGAVVTVTANATNTPFTLSASVKLAYVVTSNFVYPCCGAAITSNLATNYKVEQQIGCGSFVFTDITGTYNAQTNTGGYGAPNPTIGDVASRIVKVTLANGDVYSFNPAANPNTALTIYAADLGYTGTIADQIITIEYSVYKQGDCRIGYKKSQILLSCNTETCIYDKIEQLLTGDCGCPDTDCSQTDQVMKMLFELDAIKITAKKNMGCIDGKIEALYLKCKGGCSGC